MIMHNYLPEQLLSSQSVGGNIADIMTTASDDQKLASWRAFLLTYNTIMRQMEQEMQDEQDLPLTWYDILAHLDSAHRGALRMQELAESVLLSRSGLTRLVDRMERAGLVERHPCEEDRRGTYAVITNRGEETLFQAMPGHINSINQHFLQYLDVFDAQALLRVLTKVLEGERPAQEPQAELIEGNQ